eukprot:TRINITY_DN1825_c0_g1_i1.p1 TRINITY_DN1825_c0_g1~~TRINITY_DN1825_c0_g1_i1.p1  ORF type:complete len:276 (-),score=102.26 TRINITY_DN1825_c0_g1_i1:9-836(-)
MKTPMAIRTFEEKNSSRPLLVPHKSSSADALIALSVMAKNRRVLGSHLPRFATDAVNNNNVTTNTTTNEIGGGAGSGPVMTMTGKKGKEGSSPALSNSASSPSVFHISTSVSISAPPSSSSSSSQLVPPFPLSEVQALKRKKRSNTERPFAAGGKAMELQIRTPPFRRCNSLSPRALKWKAEAIEKKRERDQKSKKQVAAVLRELTETENNYVRDLETLIKKFIEPLKEEKILSNDKIQSLFGNVEQIYQVNSGILQDLVAKQPLEKVFAPRTLR